MQNACKSLEPGSKASALQPLAVAKGARPLSFTAGADRCAGGSPRRPTPHFPQLGAHLPGSKAAQTRRGQPVGQLKVKERVARSHCGHRYAPAFVAAAPILKGEAARRLRGGPMPSYTIRATDKETGEVRLMKVQAGTPMTEVIKQYAALSGIDEAECRFLVGGRPLKTDKPLDEQVALTATQPPPSAVIDDGDEGDCSCSCMPSMG